MILDKQNLFSDGQAITASAASENYIDFGSAREVAFGTPIEMLVNVDEAFETCTSVNFSIQTDDNTSFSSAKTLAETGAIPVGDLVVGYRPPLKYIPKGNEGYMRMYYTVAGSDATAGKVTAGIVAGTEEGHHYT